MFSLIKAGNGGRASKAIIKTHRKRILNGGKGGNGGSVYVKGSHNLYSLHKLHPNYRAENGRNGRKNKMNGENAKNLVIEVPIGTVVIEEGETIADVIDSKEHLILKGGAGGAANTNQGHSTGLKLQFDFKLKHMSDMAFIGAPNAGKSSLLAHITNAKPKIASYPFTTLFPNLGQFSANIKLADIPGIIPGAYLNRGLGHRFLQHLERTRVLGFVISATDNVAEQYNLLCAELNHYNNKMMKEKEKILIITKMDLVKDLDLDSLPRDLKILKTSVHNKHCDELNIYLTELT